MIRSAICRTGFVCWRMKLLLTQRSRYLLVKFEIAVILHVITRLRLPENESYATN